MLAEKRKAAVGFKEPDLENGPTHPRSLLRLFGAPLNFRCLFVRVEERCYRANNAGSLWARCSAAAVRLSRNHLRVAQARRRQS